MNHRLGDQQPPLHAAGQGARIGIGLVGQVHRRKQLIAVPLTLGNAIEPGLDLKRFAGREEWVEDDFLRNDADRALRIARMLVEIETPDRDIAARLDDQAREDVDQRRLAGAVRPEEPEDLPARYVEADLVERKLAAGIGL